MLARGRTRHVGGPARRRTGPRASRSAGLGTRRTTCAVAPGSTPRLGPRRALKWAGSSATSRPIGARYERGQAVVAPSPAPAAPTRPRPTPCAQCRRAQPRRSRWLPALDRVLSSDALLAWRAAARRRCLPEPVRRTAPAAGLGARRRAGRPGRRAVDRRARRAATRPSSRRATSRSDELVRDGDRAGRARRPPRPPRAGRPDVGRR